jgi:hypothetical protein
MDDFGPRIRAPPPETVTTFPRRPGTLRQVSDHIGRVAKEEQTITFRTGVAVGVLLLIAAGAFAGISGIVVGVVQAEQAVYDAHNLPIVAIITNNTEGSYACCQQAACTCAEVAEEARMCGDMLVNMTEGVRNGGYRCCSQECDTCYHTCYNTCCSTCIGFHSVCSSVDDPLRQFAPGGGAWRRRRPSRAPTHGHVPQCHVFIQLRLPCMRAIRLCAIRLQLSVHAQRRKPGVYRGVWRVLRACVHTAVCRGCRFRRPGDTSHPTVWL